MKRPDRITTAVAVPNLPVTTFWNDLTAGICSALKNYDWSQIASKLCISDKMDLALTGSSSLVATLNFEAYSLINLHRSGIFKDLSRFNGIILNTNTSVICISSQGNLLSVLSFQMSLTTQF